MSRTRQRDSETRQKFRKMLREGKLDDKEIEVEIQAMPVGVEIMAPPGMEDMTSQLQGMFQNLGGNAEDAQAEGQGRTEAADRRGSREADRRGRAQGAGAGSCRTTRHRLPRRARQGCAQLGHQGADVSREGVQRDLLPLVEGCTVNTKYGMVQTDHILFIASGAFHVPNHRT